MTDTKPVKDFIEPPTAVTIPGLFRERVRRSANAVAYRYFDARQGWSDLSWHEIERRIGQWQAAMRAEGLARGDRVAIMLNNSVEWVCCDVAAMSLGLVVVPLYTIDHAENLAHILNDSGTRLLLLRDQEQWELLQPVRGTIASVDRIVVCDHSTAFDDERVVALSEWLPDQGEQALAPDLDQDLDGEALATIVYTSGTTGMPKGVMLSHRALLWNAFASLQVVPAYTSDLFLSFLPFSHALERTAGYYLPVMAGATVAFARSVPLLAEDMVAVRPTVIVCVPRVFERAYMRIEDGLKQRSPLQQRLFRFTADIGWQQFVYEQGMARAVSALLAWPICKRLVADKVLAVLGGKLRLAVCGGAPLSPHVARRFISLGLNLVQGYGMTELGPVVSVNPVEDNDPASVGVPLPELELKIGDDEELLVRSPGVTLGYWQDEASTANLIDAEGWLRTGDKARISNNHLYITGRIKEIIVLSTGEKVPPANMEAAIMGDSLFEQAMVIGEGRPSLTALLVLNRQGWKRLAEEQALDAELPESLQAASVKEVILQRVSQQLRSFPGYGQVHRVIPLLEAWTVENGLLTPTLKLRRPQLKEFYRQQIENAYKR